ncbi:hypothetical protein LTS18_013208, partial [Coniosporium uncinatum]
MPESYLTSTQWEALQELLHLEQPTKVICDHTGVSRRYVQLMRKRYEVFGTLEKPMKLKPGPEKVITEEAGDYLLE